jgi:hypothetical protein
MWQSTQELPALPAPWRVCALSRAPISWWHPVHSALLLAASCGFLSMSGSCGSRWQLVHVARPRRKHSLCHRPMASFENRRGRPSGQYG